MKRPFFFIALGLSCGIATASVVDIPLFCSFSGVVAFLLLALARKRNFESKVFLSVAMILVGALLYKSSTILPPEHISYSVKDEPFRVSLRGVVVDDPIVRTVLHSRTKRVFLLRADSMKIGDVWRGSSGIVMVETPHKAPELNFGDEVVVDGELSRIPALRNPGAFDYSRYMQLKNVYGLVRMTEKDVLGPVKGGGGIVRRAAYGLRHKIRNLIDAYFGQEESALLEAILIGDRTDISAATRDEFVKTGTVHILAISGLHVGLVAGIFLVAFKLLSIPKKARYALAICVLALFALISGSNPPVVRATIMFAIFAIGKLLDREPEGLNSLGIAALLMLFSNPKELFDPSFQLSFVAILSLMVFTPKLARTFSPKKGNSHSFRAKAGSYLTSAASASLAATLGTAPFIAHYFNILSPIALVANIVIIPMLFLLELVLILFLAVGAISAPLAFYGAGLVSQAERALFIANGVFARIPFSHIRVPSPSIAGVALYYLVLSLFFLPAVSYMGRIRVSKVRVSILVLVIGNIFVWKDAIAPRPPLLKITFLDVGYGDSAFIEFPHGGTMLVDGGSGGMDDKFDMGRLVIGPFLWNKSIRAIDAAVLTHPDEDHLGGLLFVLNNFKVGCVIDNGLAKFDSDVYRDYLRTIHEKGIRRVRAREGDKIQGFDGVELYVLNPPEEEGDLDSNESSLVIKAVFGDTSILLTGDIGEHAMKFLIGKNISLESDVLKVPHHGGKIGKGDTARRFFALVRPKASIISVSRRNRFRAPSKETVDIITDLKSNIYETRECGAIVVTSDGEHAAARRFCDLTRRDEKN